MSGWAMILSGLSAVLGVLAVAEAVGSREDGPGPGGSRPVQGAGIGKWLKATIEPLRRVGREGYLPTSDERFRISVLFGLGAMVVGWWVAGPLVGLFFAVGSPLVAGWLISRGRRKYRRAVERSIPDVARAIADCLSAGHSPRGALAAATASLEGPVKSEFQIMCGDLETGAATADAIQALARRFGSARLDAFATALLSQRLAGGDLSALLRRFAEGAAERDRVAEDARSATAQARFTGYLVVAMPAGAALFTELIRPGFFGSIVGSLPALMIVGVSILLQGAGFVLISRLARIEAT